ncbi:MAG: hypothetical protein ABL915_02575 [Gallionella sp.]
MKQQQAGVVTVVVVLGMAAMMGGMWLASSFIHAQPSVSDSRAAVDSIAERTSVTATAVTVNPHNSEGGLSSQ